MLDVVLAQASTDATSLPSPIAHCTCAIKLCRLAPRRIAAENDCETERTECPVCGIDGASHPVPCITSAYRVHGTAVTRDTRCHLEVLSNPEMAFRGYRGRSTRQRQGLARSYTIWRSSSSSRGEAPIGKQLSNLGRKSASRLPSAGFVVYLCFLSSSGHRECGKCRRDQRWRLDSLRSAYFVSL